MLFDLPKGTVRFDRVGRETHGFGSIYCLSSPHSKPWIAQRLPSLIKAYKEETGVRVHQSWAYGLLSGRITYPMPNGVTVSKISLERLNELQREHGVFVWTGDIDSWVIRPDLDAME